MPSSPDQHPSPSISTILSTTQRPLTLDGALSTHLETLGVPLSPTLWSASLLQTHPDTIWSTHLTYFQSGAQIATTCSYQASLPGLVSHLQISESVARSLVRRSVELAREARDAYLASLPEGERKVRVEKGLWIAGSVGPYGAFLGNGSEYRGDYQLSSEEFKAHHRGRMQELVAAGADILALETIPSFTETRALVELLREEFPGTVAWVSFTLKDEKRISDGTSVQDVLAFLDSEAAEQVVAVGVNCVPHVLTTPAVRELRRYTRKPLVVYPNSGEEWDAKGRVWKGERNEGGGLEESVREWKSLDVRIVGGCCRTRPDDVEVIRRVLGEASG